MDKGLDHLLSKAKKIKMIRDSRSLTHTRTHIKKNSTIIISTIKTSRKTYSSPIATQGNKDWLAILNKKIGYTYIPSIAYICQKDNSFTAFSSKTNITQNKGKEKPKHRTCITAPKKKRSLVFEDLELPLQPFTPIFHFLALQNINFFFFNLHFLFPCIAPIHPQPHQNQSNFKLESMMNPVRVWTQVYAYEYTFHKGPFAPLSSTKFPKLWVRVPNACLLCGVIPRM